MAETIDEILNGSDESTNQVVDQQVDDVEEGQDELSTGEDDVQVAAENNDQTDAAQPTEVRTELKALAKERERIRQKEAALDAERAKLQEQQLSQTSKGDGEEGSSSTPVELKELRRQHREALEQAIVDPTDEEAAKRVDDLEDRLEAARLQQITQALKSESVQERAVADFNETFDAVHAAYPFLDPDHPQVSKELNADINAFYEGLIKRGESKASALRKAVDTFAPAHARKLGITTTRPATQRSAAQAASGVAREKLKGGFSEVPGTSGGSRTSKPFTGPTPMDDILGRSST